MKSPVTFTRREAMTQGLRSALSPLQSSMPQWMPRIAVSNDRATAKGDVLVCIFLRGGADGLNVVVPHGEAIYYKVRPNIAIARPDDAKADAMQKAIDLDGFFGLHPVMAPLVPYFQGKQMLAVHAVGSPDSTRSHFDAMDTMERGTPGEHTLGTGWLGRHLDSLDTGGNAFLRAVGWGDALPGSLRGSISATALRSIIDYHLGGRTETAVQMLSTINSLYSIDTSGLKNVATQTKAVIDLINKVDIKNYMPEGGATYDQNSDIDMALKQTAALIKADVGLEISAIDLGGWDHHVNELPGMSYILGRLSKALAAFAADVSKYMNKVTVVVMSEFGRRVSQNADNGTDHGHGNMMLVMGGNVAPKPVITKWPGLDDAKLDSGIDLAITIDYRDVLSEILQKRMNNPKTDLVFPGYKPTLPGVVK